MPNFMQHNAAVPSAAPWLSDVAVLEKQKAADWVRALRATGAEQFSQTGLPTVSWEGWQHTNLRLLTGAKYRYSAEAVTFDAGKLPASLLQDSGRVVVVNGQYQPQFSDLPLGVTVMSLMEAAAEKLPGIEQYLVSVGDLGAMPFKALNTAYMHDGFVLKVRGDVERPVEVIFYNVGGAEMAPAVYPRVLYWLAENSGLTLLERHVGEGAYFANLYTAIGLEAASRLRFYRFEEESDEACHVSLTVLQQQKASVFEGFSYACGGRLARQEYQNLLIDSEISSSISGISLSRSQQCHDFTALTDHFEPGGKSAQRFKGVIDDQARAIFQGKIQVRRAAQKTDGNQLNHALLLSEEAEASFKPELEIYADDVKCSHGAASGKLDESALFYMRSRGIPEAEARALLIESFLSDAVEQISFAPVQEIVRRKAAAWLAEGKR